MEDHGISIIMDFPGESISRESQAVEHFNRYFKIFTLGKKYGVKEVDAACKLTGLSTNILEPSNRRIFMNRMRDLLRAAIANGVYRLTIDMEQTWFVDTSLGIFKALLTDPEFKGKMRLEIVNQGYLVRSLEDAEDMTPVAVKIREETGATTNIRLVKGAYADSEKRLAAEEGGLDPIMPSKVATDENYERLIDYYLDHWNSFRVAFATHNRRQVCYVIARAIQKGIDPSTLEFQMLNGMPSTDFLEGVRLAYGCKITLYGLIGTTDETIPYLARRMTENKDMNSCFSGAERYDRGEIPLWQLVQPPKEAVDAVA